MNHMKCFASKNKFRKKTACKKERMGGLMGGLEQKHKEAGKGRS